MTSGVSAGRLLAGTPVATDDGSGATAYQLQVILAGATAAAAASTIADGADVAEGAKADAAYAGSGAASLVAINKGIYSLLAAPLPAGTNAIGSITNASFGVSGTLPAFAAIPAFKIDQTTPGTTNLVAAGQNGTWNITNVSGTVSLPTGASTSALQTTGNTSLATIATNTSSPIVAGTNLIGKVGIDQTTLGTTNAVSLKALAQSANPSAYTDATYNPLAIGVRGAVLVSLGSQAAGSDATGLNNFIVLSRDVSGGAASQGGPLATMQYQYDGSTYNRSRGDTNGSVTQPYAMTSSRWQYAAATGGIVNTTTAVTFIAAAGSSVRNYAVAIQFDWDSLGAATELVVRDGAAGTVIWRRKIPAGVAGMDEVALPVPLKGTANTLMEVATLTASVTGGVYFNAQGFQGS